MYKNVPIAVFFLIKSYYNNKYKTNCNCCTVEKKTFIRCKNVRTGEVNGEYVKKNKNVKLFMKFDPFH